MSYNKVTRRENTRLNFCYDQFFNGTAKTDLGPPSNPVLNSIGSVSTGKFEISEIQHRAQSANRLKYLTGLTITC